jgi:hypothetical protein
MQTIAAIQTNGEVKLIKASNREVLVTKKVTRHFRLANLIPNINREYTNNEHNIVISAS